MAAALVASRFIPSATEHFLSTVPPLYGAWDPAVGVWFAIPLSLAVAFSAFAPRSLRIRRSWAFLGLLIGASFAMSLALNVASLPSVHSFLSQSPPASVAGIIQDPFNRGTEYYAAIPAVQIMGVRDFAQLYPSLDRAGVLPQHVSTHAPGGPVLLWALWRLLGRSRLLVCIGVALIGVLGSLPTYAIAKEVYGKAAARRAALLFACCPGLLLYAFTSMDVVFMTAAAVALAAAVRARRSIGWALAAGVLTMFAAALDWGALSAGVVAVGMWAVEMRAGSSLREVSPRAVGWAAGALAGSALLKATLGIDLAADFAAGAARQASTLTYARPFGYWVIGNLAAFFITAGLAQSSLLLTEVRRRWRARGPGFETVVMATILIVDLSTAFKGETDRNWLFFLPLVVSVAGAAAERVRTSATIGLAQSLTEGALLFTWS